MTQAEVFQLLALNNELVRLSVMTDQQGWEELKTQWQGTSVRAAATPAADSAPAKLTGRASRFSFSAESDADVLEIAEMGALGSVLTVQLEKDDGKLGISLVGGVNTPLKGTFINAFQARHEGKLAVGDRILAVDGQHLSQAVEGTVKQAVAVGQEATELTLARVPFARHGTEGLPALAFGLEEAGTMLKMFVPSASMDQLRLALVNDGSVLPWFVEYPEFDIQAGDRLVAVNERLATPKTLEEITALLDGACASDAVTLSVWRLSDTSREAAFPAHAKVRGRNREGGDGRHAAGSRRTQVRRLGPIRCCRRPSDARCSRVWSASAEALRHRLPCGPGSLPSRHCEKLTAARCQHRSSREAHPVLPRHLCWRAEQRTGT
jgi:hypothetical protein